MAVLQDMTQVQAELAKLRAENERLKAAAQRKVTVKLGEKGTISVYGVGRFPVSLYKSQWQRVLAKETIVSIEALYALAPDKE